MRTTIEISDAQRARLLELAAARGEEGFSVLVQEALEAYLDSRAQRGERVSRALLDLAAARAAAQARLALERQGQPIGMADYLIAGIALSRGAPLLTRNRAHFERVPGLELATL